MPLPFVVQTLLAQSLFLVQVPPSAAVPQSGSGAGQPLGWQTLSLPQLRGQSGSRSLSVQAVVHLPSFWQGQSGSTVLQKVPQMPSAPQLATGWGSFSAMNLSIS